MYEGYAPGGVAVLVECLTDNRNRAASEVRTAMTRNGGNMADPGSVAYLFNRKGVVLVPKAGRREDDVCIAVLDAGAEEVNDVGEAFEVVSEPADLSRCGPRCRAPASTTTRPSVTFVPSVTVSSTRTAPGRCFRLIEALEDFDDVQNVFANFDVSDEVLALVD